MKKRRSTDGLSLRKRLEVEVTEAYNLLNDKASRIFCTLRFIYQQHNVIAILYVASPLSTSDILERMFEKNAGVYRMVDRLVKKNWLPSKSTSQTNV